MMDIHLFEVIIAILASGFLSTVITLIYTRKSERRTLQIEALREQLRALYGPLYFFTSQNEALFDLERQFTNAYDSYFGKDWSHKESTQNQLKKEADSIIEIRNSYIKRVEDNNKVVKDILRNNYAYMEVEDVKAFTEFVIDHNCLEVESRTKRQAPTPPEVYEEVGEISFMRTDLIKLAKRRFEEKQSKLSALLKRK